MFMALVPFNKLAGQFWCTSVFTRVLGACIFSVFGISGSCRQKLALRAPRQVPARGQGRGRPDLHDVAELLAGRLA